MSHKEHIWPVIQKSQLNWASKPISLIALQKQSFAAGFADIICLER